VSAVAVVLIVLLALGLFSGCSSKPAAKPTLKVGIVAPMTGPVATFGVSYANGAKMAADEWNAKGGIKGRQIQPIVEDDKIDPTEGVNAVQKLLNQDQVLGIIGPVGSAVALAVAPICQAAGVPMITGTATTDKLSDSGDFIFRACFKDSFQGLVMSKFASENLSAKKAAVLYDLGNDYSKGLAESFRDAFQAAGGQVVAFETYGKDDVDFLAQLTTIKAAAPDVVFLPDYYNKVGPIAAQARQLGITVPLLGGDGWDSPDLVTLAGQAVEGCFFSNHYSADLENPEATAFLANFKKAFGKDPDALAALAYDSANILFAAMAGAANPDDKAAVRDVMAKTSGFRAVTGVITFDANGDPVKSAVVITIENQLQKFVTSVAP
jgi:branched-chain amino acid transport system substrate-binding protein